jgi:hypothetical protein
VGHEEEKHFGFGSFYCLLFPVHKRKSMFAVLRSNINTLINWPALLQKE